LSRPRKKKLRRKRAAELGEKGGAREGINVGKGFGELRWGDFDWSDSKDNIGGALVSE